MSQKKPLANYGGLIKEIAAADSIAVTIGGTGIKSYALGDMIYASALSVLSNLAAGTTGQVLLIVAGIPKWCTEVMGLEFTGSTASTITLPNSPIGALLRCYKNGMRLPAFKFSLSGSVVTLTDSRNTSDIFQFDFKY